MTYDDAIKLLRGNELEKKQKEAIVNFLLTERARETPVEPYVQDDVGTKWLYCPECQHVVGKKYVYCSKCGQRLDMRYI